jgi:predicted KAP-like P-loop ATPase
MHSIETACVSNEVDAPLHGDRPIENPDDDRLGFRPAAEHVAKAIHTMASPDGFVIGIEGEWGSGKSSFINLVSDSLIRLENAPEIVRFLPWLISSREGLLKELFTEIIAKALNIESSEPVEGWRKRTLQKLGWQRYSTQAKHKKRLKSLLSKFSTRLVQAGKLADLLGAAGAGAAAEAGTNAAEEWLNNGSLDKEKSQVRHELRFLKRKIVIFIDDLDRLEPSEVVEILRLVRAVVDFPNVVFVLCYSLDIITKNLSTALNVEKGEDFLEKIVQVSFSVPRPEAFDLRRMLRGELEALFPRLLEENDPQSRSIQQRLSQVIDDEGGRALATPRHVIRAVNALRFHTAPVLGEIDVSDMVWLQLIRLQSPKLYQWVENYLIEFAAKSAGASISKEGIASSLRKLNFTLDEMQKTHGAREAQMHSLASILPGVDFDLVGTDSVVELTLYKSENPARLVRDKRIGSPQHYRYYFALTAPQGAISDKLFSEFIKQTHESPEDAATYFYDLSSKMTPSGQAASQAILDRLKGKGIEQVPKHALPGLLRALAQSMDIASLTLGPGDFGRNWIWGDAEHLFASAWRRISRKERERLAKNLFRSGASLGWLTEILRRETFSHGIYGNRSEPESEWLMSNSELESAGAALLERYKNLKPEQLNDLPRITPLLYAWMQYDSSALPEIRKKVESLTSSDEDFLNFLDKMRTWQNTNGTISYPLRESDVSIFLDVTESRKRLKRLTSKSALSSQAQQLLEAMRKDRSE